MFIFLQILEDRAGNVKFIFKIFLLLKVTYSSLNCLDICRCLRYIVNLFWLGHTIDFLNVASFVCMVCKCFIFGEPKC